ncbi:hypothetical protein YC2023_030634 [Brassica napus]
MVMSDIPQDLIEEILSRVPAASLKRLRSTCKRWNHLFKDQRFTEKHFRNAPKQSRILISNDYRICSVNVNLNVAPPPIEFKDFHPCSHQQIHVVEVFHCDGLLLCTIWKDNKYRLMVWNPCSGETRWIQTTTYSKSFSTRSLALGYQNNKSFRSYKILSCWSTSYSLIQGDAGFKIYDLSSDYWRVLDDDLALRGSTIPNRGVSCKGNAYWLVTEKTGGLLGFDFTRNSFIRFCLPPIPNPCDMILSVVREEKLSLLYWSRRVSYMEVWMTNEIDGTQAALWSKSFTVKNPNNFIPCFMSFLVDEEKKLVLGCNSAFGGDHIKKLYTTGEDSGYSTEIPSRPITFAKNYEGGIGGLNLMMDSEAVLNDVSRGASELGHVPDLGNALMDVDEE